MNLYTIIIIFIAFLIFSYIYFSFRLGFRPKLFFINLAAVLFILFIRSGVFIVNEGSQAVVTQFGAIVGEPYTKAGIYFKIPFIWKVNYFDKRIFRESEFQTRAPTKDGYFITVDEVFNWRINNPSLFIQSMHNIDMARMVIKNNVSGAIRQAVAANDLLSIIRTDDRTDPIATFLKNIRNELPQQDPSQKVDVAGNTLLGISINIETGRSDILAKVKKSSYDYLSQFGIELVGVFIRSVKYDPSVEKTIFNRMYQERMREAERLRSSGRSEAQRIKGQTRKKYQEIMGPANQQALLIKGEAEATALKIQAESFGKNEPFYNYWRMLRVYEENLPNMSQGIIFSMESPLLKWINDGDRQVNNQSTKK